MNALLATASAAALLAAGAFALAPTAEIVTEVEIDATPNEVWAVLTDTAGYREWNPFLISMEGDLVEGARLTNRMKPANGGVMTFRPTVLTVSPGKELRWLGRLLLPRLFDGEHYFLLHEHAGRTHLVHGERFRGIGLWFLDVQRFRADFEAMNTALKERVEAGEAESSA